MHDHRRGKLLLLAFLAVLVTGGPAGCQGRAQPSGTGSSGTMPTGRPSPSSSPSPAAAPSVTTPPPTASARTAGGQATVSEPDNGTTVQVSRGTRVLLVLHSTYWSITGSSDAAVLTAQTAPVHNPISQGCVPGGGCGTVSQSFLATSPGTAQLRASRTVCGDAMACSPGQGTFTVTVQVTAG